MVQEKQAREKRFWYLAELRETPEIAECREKYLAELASSPHVSFSDFARSYLGRPLPSLQTLFEVLGRRGYRARTLSIKDQQSGATFADTSSAIHMSVAFCAQMPIKKNDLDEVEAVSGFAISAE